MSQEDSPHSPSDSSPAPDDGKSSAPPWTGRWRVLRWDGQTPPTPTYYVATPESWDVVTIREDGPHVAPHPILEVDDDVIVLKDEGADDTDRERWRAAVTGNRLTVTALTGPHEGAVGVAERTSTDPHALDPGEMSPRSG